MYVARIHIERTSEDMVSSTVSLIGSSTKQMYGNENAVAYFTYAFITLTNIVLYFPKAVQVLPTLLRLKALARKTTVPSRHKMKLTVMGRVSKYVPLLLHHVHNIPTMMYTLKSVKKFRLQDLLALSVMKQTAQ